MSLIEVRDLQKHFVVTRKPPGVLGGLKSVLFPQKDTIRAVDGVSFEVEQGEILGYIGPNGAGKSTTMKVLTGVLTPTAGEAVVDGHRPYENRQDNARRIGFVFGQRSRLWWLLPAYDSIEYTRAIYSISEEVFERNFAYCSKALGLEPILGKPVRVLSLGERMRVELAVSMLHGPKILYLDEPTVGLDVVAKGDLREMIHDINREFGTTVLLATHDVMDIEKLCERVLIIDRGKLAWQGSLDDLRKAKGDKRLVSVDFVSEVQPLKMEGVRPIEAGVRKHVYEVDPGKAKLEEVIQTLAKSGQVVDIEVSPAQIEDVSGRSTRKVCRHELFRDDPQGSGTHDPLLPIRPHRECSAEHSDRALSFRAVDGFVRRQRRCGGCGSRHDACLCRGQYNPGCPVDHASRGGSRREDLQWRHRIDACPAFELPVHAFYGFRSRDDRTCRDPCGPLRGGCGNPVLHPRWRTRECEPSVGYQRCPQLSPGISVPARLWCTGLLDHGHCRPWRVSHCGHDGFLRGPGTALFLPGLAGRHSDVAAVPGHVPHSAIHPARKAFRRSRCSRDGCPGTVGSLHGWTVVCPVASCRKEGYRPWGVRAESAIAALYVHDAAVDPGTHGVPPKLLSDDVFGSV